MSDIANPQTTKSVKDIIAERSVMPQEALANALEKARKAEVERHEKNLLSAYQSVENKVTAAIKHYGDAKKIFRAQQARLKALAAAKDAFMESGDIEGLNAAIGTADKVFRKSLSDVSTYYLTDGV